MAERKAPSRPRASFTGQISNKSGTASGADQTPIGDNPGRRFLLIQNPSTNANSVWVEFGAAAVQASPSVELVPGATLVFEGEFIPSQAIHVIGPATTVYTIKEA